MRDMEAIADVIAMAVKSAVAPMQAQIAVLNSQIDYYRNLRLEDTIAGVRDRVGVLETKAATPVVPQPPIDLHGVLAPLHERLAVAEAHIARSVDGPDLSPLEGRLSALEALPRDVPPVPDVAGLLHPIHERLSVAEAHIADVKSSQAVAFDAFPQVRDRVVRLETKAEQPPTVPEPDFAPLYDRITGVQEQMAAMQRSLGQLPELAGRVTAIESKPEPVFAPVDTGLSERMAAAEVSIGRLASLEREQDGLIERVVTLETRAATPLTAVVPDADLRDRVTALASVPERLAATEATVARIPDVERSVGAMAERLITVEAKAVVPILPPDAIGPLTERVAATEATLARLPLVEREQDAMVERLVTLETKVATPTIVTPDLDLRERIVKIETAKAAPHGVDAAKVEALDRAITAMDNAYTKELSTLRERIAVVEVKPLLPGPPGRDGVDGKDGKDGKDGQPGPPGADGLGYDDLAVVQEDDRTFAMKAFRGDRAKTIGTWTSHAQMYRGVWLEAKTYERGDCVTWGGSQWHCNETTTTKPGDGSKAWTLMVKRGRDGRDGKDADGGVVVKARP